MVRIDYPVENPMVRPGIFEEIREVIGYCEGCGAGIEEDEQFYDDNGVLLHKDPFCCQKYVSQLAVEKGGERIG